MVFEYRPRFKCIEFINVKKAPGTLHSSYYTHKKKKKLQNNFCFQLPPSLTATLKKDSVYGVSLQMTILIGQELKVPLVPLLPVLLQIILKGQVSYHQSSSVGRA